MSLNDIRLGAGNEDHLGVSPCLLVPLSPGPDRVYLAYPGAYAPQPWYFQPAVFSPKPLALVFSARLLQPQARLLQPQVFIPLSSPQRR